MGTSLTGVKIKDSYDAIIKVSDNGALDGTLQTLTDGLGNDSALSLSTAGASVTGTLAVSGVSTLTGNVGIGVSPENSLTILKSSSTSSANGGEGQLRIYNTNAASGNVGIWLGNSSLRKAAILAEKQSTSNNHDLLFLTNGIGSDATERMRITSLGNVGIGTSTVKGKLHSWQGDSGQSSANGVANGLVIEDNQGQGISILTPSTNEGNIFFGDESDNFVGGIRYYHPTNALAFEANNAERMRIDSSGNLLMFGDPAYIKSNSGSLVLQGQNGNLDLHADPASTHASSTLKMFVDGSERMRITSGGFLKVGSTSTTSRHEISSGTSGNSVIDIVHTNSLSPYGIDIDFSASSPNNTANFFLRGQDSTTNRVIIYSNGNIVNANNSYGAISDAKLKENVVDASPKLEDLMQVKVRNFNYIGDDKKQLGVVAQELEEVFPSMIDESPDTEEIQVEVRDEEGNIVYKTEQVLVSEAVEAVYEEVVHPAEEAILDEEGNVIEEAKEEWIEQVLVTPAQEAVYETITLDEPEMTTEKVDLGTVTKSVKYSVFVPMMIKAIQEQQEIINDLKARIEALEG